MSHGSVLDDDDKRVELRMPPVFDGLTHVHKRINR